MRKKRLKKDSILEVFSKLNNNPDIILKTTILPSIIKGNAFYKDNVISININAVNNMKEVYNIIGRRIGAVISGGEIDYERVSKAILEDIKNERIKGITFDIL